MHALYTDAGKGTLKISAKQPNGKTIQVGLHAGLLVLGGRQIKKGRSETEGTYSCLRETLNKYITASLHWEKPSGEWNIATVTVLSVAIIII